MTQPQQSQSPTTTYEAGTTGSAATGRFVWHDLMSTDPARSLAFYTALFGWTTQTMPMGDLGDYTMLFAGTEGIGGVVPLDASHGTPSHWIGYATVPDVDEACALAERLGGAVCVPATDIPNVGRFAVLADNAGAIISPFCALPGQTSPDAMPTQAGRFCWDELMTDDPEGAMRFHGGVFGWRYEPVDLGPMGSYWIARRGEVQAGGMMRLPADAQASGARPHWLAYVLVDSVDDSATRAAELGATVLVQPADIPQIGRFAVLMDPTGALIALFRGQM